MARHQLALFWLLCCAWTSLAVPIAPSTANGDVEGANAKHNYSVFLGEVMMAGDDPTGDVDVSTPDQPNTLESVEGQGSVNDYGNNDILRNLVKRAPNGFTGMRGKKANELVDWTLDDTEAADELQDLYASRFKKAPSGFYGVRGKKYPAPGSINRYADWWQRIEEQRLRDLLVQEFIDRLASAAAASNEVIEKRAPTGFTGMRGKRMYDGSYSMGDAAAAAQLFKRGPSSAFVGVRGKKEASGDYYVDDHSNFKRSPAEKSRGKNSRFVDFSNKFVAVRGKKSENTLDDEDTSAYGYAEDEGVAAGGGARDSSEDRPLVANLRERYYVNMYPALAAYGVGGKRTPNGFVGMRGKRSAPGAEELH